MLKNFSNVFFCKLIAVLLCVFFIFQQTSYGLSPELISQAKITNSKENRLQIVDPSSRIEKTQDPSFLKRSAAWVFTVCLLVCVSYFHVVPSLILAFTLNTRFFNSMIGLISTCIFISILAAQLYKNTQLENFSKHDLTFNIILANIIMLGIFYTPLFALHTAASILLVNLLFLFLTYTAFLKPENKPVFCISIIGLLTIIGTRIYGVFFMPPQDIMLSPFENSSLSNLLTYIEIWNLSPFISITQSSSIIRSLFYPLFLCIILFGVFKKLTSLNKVSPLLKVSLLITIFPVLLPVFTPADTVFFLFPILVLYFFSSQIKLFIAKILVRFLLILHILFSGGIWAGRLMEILTLGDWYKNIDGIIHQHKRVIYTQGRLIPSDWSFSMWEQITRERIPSIANALEGTYLSHFFLFLAVWIAYGYFQKRPYNISIREGIFISKKLRATV